MFQVLLKLILGVFIGVFGPVSHSWALTEEKDCSPRDLRSSVGEIRDQGTRGWCFAYAASDLLTFRFFDLQHRASPNFLALKSNVFSGQPLGANGGKFSDITQTVISMGVCNSESGDSASLDKLTRLKQAFKNHDSLSVSQIIHELSQPEQIFYGVPSDQVRRLLDYPEKYFAEMVLLSVCDSKVVSVPDIDVIQESIDKINPRTKIKYTKDELLVEIRRQLSEQNIIGISYNGNILFSSHPRFFVRHASSIVGRRWAQNRCELLIRNSWGKDCGAPEKPKYFSFDSCESGSVWIPEENLLPHLEGVVYLPLENK